MSGSNDPNGTHEGERSGQPRGNAGGQQPNQGGTPAGQPQGGQQAAGGQGQQGVAQGGQQAAGGQGQQGVAQGGQYAQTGGYAQGGGFGGSNLLGDLRQPEPKRYLKGIVGTMGVASVLLGAMSFLLGLIGGFPFVPGAVEVAGSAASAMSGSSSAPQVGQLMGTTHQLTIGYLTAEIAPFVAFGLAPLIGLFVATRMGTSEQTRRKTAGIGVFLGAFVFILVTTVIASFAVPSLSAFADAAGSSAAGMGGLGIPSASQLSGSLNNLSSLQFGNLLINSVIVGLMGGIAAFASAYAADTFLGENATY